MRRQASLEEISDGRLYTLNDMVKADCGGCRGCFACCKGMGNSIVLDPMDVWRLCAGLKKDFSWLAGAAVSLGMVDGLILPSLKMNGKEEACFFLGEDGRCRVHSFRPGICRIFPLGRYYENDHFSYFLQIHECKKENRTKVKVKKWIDMKDPKVYDQFIRDWHYYLEELEEKVNAEEAKGDQEIRKAACLHVLTCFYQTPYQAESGDEEGFYREFYERLQESRKNK